MLTLKSNTKIFNLLILYIVYNLRTNCSDNPEIGAYTISDIMINVSYIKNPKECVECIRLNNEIIACYVRLTCICAIWQYTQLLKKKRTLKAEMRGNWLLKYRQSF